jgi:hypothetical protein
LLLGHVSQNLVAANTLQLSHNTAMYELIGRLSSDAECDGDKKNVSSFDDSLITPSICLKWRINS